MGRKKKNNSPPETEVRLTELQQKFLEDRSNQKVIDEFFLLLKSYARSTALQIIRESGGKYLPPERIDEIATEAVTLTFEQYKRRPEWKVGKSFYGQLRFKCYEAMYKQAKDEMQSSLNNTITNESDKEMIELLSESQGVVPWDTNRTLKDSYDPVDGLVRSINVAPEEVDKLLDQAYELLPYKTYIVFLCWLLLKLRKPKTRNISENFKKTVNLTSAEEQTFEYLLLEMKHRIEYHS